MMNNTQLSDILTEHLELSMFPVAVSVYPEIDDGMSKMYSPDKPLRSYCHGIMLAADGKTLYLSETDILCKSGAATLGFLNYSEDMLSGRKHSNAGVFETAEAARNSVKGAFKLERGSTKGLLLTPLANADNYYQTVLLTANAEQIMFLIVANKYDTGGRTDISMATGFQGICGDATVYPIQTGKVNFSVTGFGDRMRCGLSPELTMVGIPAERISVIANNLVAMSSKLMKKYKEQRRSKA